MSSTFSKSITNRIFNIMNIRWILILAAGIVLYCGYGVSQETEMPKSAEEWLTLGKFIMGKGDKENALLALVMSANLGNAEAQHTVGMELIDGDDDDAKKEGFNFLLKAAEQKHPRANLVVGICYLKGQGVEKDSLMGLGYVGRAANLGDEDAIEMFKEFTSE